MKRLETSLAKIIGKPVSRELRACSASHAAVARFVGQPFHFASQIGFSDLGRKPAGIGACLRSFWRCCERGSRGFVVPIGEKQ
ncbi:MAG: hypothetical protein ACXWBS_10880, partial [Chthoniobacterales bacterium]